MEIFVTIKIESQNDRTFKNTICILFSMISPHCSTIPPMLGYRNNPLSQYSLTFTFNYDNKYSTLYDK